MRKRNGKRNVSSTGSDPRKAGGGHRRKEDTPSRRWLKISLLALFFIILVPISLRTLPDLIQHFVHTYRIRVPFFIDLSRPTEFSLNHTINMYLTPEEGISLGVWHTVPDSQWKEAQGKDSAWYERSLGDGSPVFIYLHGNTGSREAPHRVGVSKVLSALGYHVLVPDYRGFGDSTGEPTEAGLTTDALYMYKWVKARCGDSLVVIWGHSLGTGVATNSAVKLIEEGVIFDGVILEGTFNSDNNANLAKKESTAQQAIQIHPFSWYYWKFPGVGSFFPEPWAHNTVVFPSVENLKKMKNPILFLHAEDDHLAPFPVLQKMYEVAVSAQNAERVKLEPFDGSKGYLHNGLYKDPKLPGVLRNFVKSLQS